jgi:hypothetical protein
MKNILKYTLIVLLAGFALAACSKDDDNAEPRINKSLNGVWDRTDIEITVSGNTAVFSKVNSGSIWLKFLNAGVIHIGDSKFKNIVATSDSTWTCEELWNREDSELSVFWEAATLKMAKDGKKITSTSRGTTEHTFTRK